LSVISCKCRVKLGRCCGGFVYRSLALPGMVRCCWNRSWAVVGWSMKENVDEECLLKLAVGVRSVWCYGLLA
jgi:hypothetical protein